MFWLTLCLSGGMKGRKLSKEREREKWFCLVVWEDVSRPVLGTERILALVLLFTLDCCAVSLWVAGCLRCSPFARFIIFTRAVCDSFRGS